MIDIKLIRENPAKVKQAAKDKGRKVDIDAAIKLDRERRLLSSRLDTLRHQHKKFGKDDIAAAKKSKSKLRELERQVREKSDKLKSLLYKIPNIPAEDVPKGKDESDNVVLRTVGKKTEFDFQPLDHIKLGARLDIIDIERAAKVAGARSYYLKNEAVLLEFALVKFALEKLSKKGFIPIIPPVMINSASMRAMGYLEHGEDKETYYLSKDDKYLVGTSEQSIGPYYSGEVLDENDLPKKFVGFSTCFRREAGSYGKDVKGILRTHQFDKLEMFVYSRPQSSNRLHEELVSIEEELMRGLELPYRVVKICTGDLGDPAARKFDIETWMPSQGEYRETHSASTTTDFQARRLNIKYKSRDGKLNFVHTLNGTVFAVGRILIAILENYQRKDGSVEIPQALRDYCRTEIIRPKK